MKQTQRARLERRNEDVVLPLEELSPGDFVSFVGTGDHAGFRFGEVVRTWPILRTVKLRKWAIVGGKEFTFWVTVVHEDRLVAKVERGEPRDLLEPWQSVEGTSPPPGDGGETHGGED
ncbi:MAG: hypothetical protein V3U45_08360 [bacterium]